MREAAVADSRGFETTDPKRGYLTSSSSYSIDDHLFLWTAGGGCLGIVDLVDMEYDLVDGLGGMGPGEYLPLAAVSAELGRKVMVVATLKASNTCYLKYWQKSELPKPPLTVPAEYLDPERRLR